VGYLICTLLTCCPPLFAQDSTLPVDQLSALATLIGVATVSGVEVKENPENRMIYTYYSLKFNEVWKGTPTEPAVLIQAGGKLGGRVTAIAGREFKFETGDTIVLFAHASPLGPYVIIGINQGVYQLGAGAERPVRRMSDPAPRRATAMLPLADLKREVFAALNVPYQAPGPSVPTLAPKERPVPPPVPASPESVPDPSNPRSRAPAPPESGRGLEVLAAALLLAAGAAWILLSKKRRQRLIE